MGGRLTERFLIGILVGVDILEQALIEKIERLEADVKLHKQALSELRSQNQKQHGPTVNGQPVMTVNGLVRAALNEAPNEFDSTFIRDYVRKRLPSVNTGTLNAAIQAIVKPTTDTIESGKGGVPSKFRKRPTI